MAELFRTGYWHYYAQLPPHMQRLYMRIYQGLYAGNADFTFQAEAHNGVYPPPEKVSEIVDFVLRDNPALYFVNLTNVKIYASFTSGVIRIAYTDYYTPAQRKQIEQELRSRAEPILAFLRQKEGYYARLHDIYRYIVATIKGDLTITKTDSQRNTEARSIVGPLLHRSAVCGGFASVFKLLCDQVGISCFIMIGPAKTVGGWASHAWNVVRLKGRFYHIDTAYDSSYFHRDKHYAYHYYLRCDRRMKKDHKWDGSTFQAEKDFL